MRKVLKKFKSFGDMGNKLKNKKLPVMTWSFTYCAYSFHVIKRLL